MEAKLRVAVLCGGKSPEHEISLCSAWNLVSYIDKSKFEVLLIGIDKSGRWSLLDIERFLAQEPFAGSIALPASDRPLAVIPGGGRNGFLDILKNHPLPPVDVFFPMIHGPNCEDGSMQGLIQQLGLPVVGPGVLSSAICMDKDVAKRLMQQAGIPTSDFITIYSGDRTSISYEAVVERLGSPVFIKPANMGSSVGVSKVTAASEFKRALESAFRFDRKVLVEQFIDGREIECAVLGNDDPVSSIPGQYLHGDAFFAYDTKYLKGREVKMAIPAPDLDDDTIERAKSLALESYKCLQCTGLSRVDIFLSPDGTLRVNEVNTLPGFTNSSMYPGLMESAGISYTDLITRLIELAIEAFKDNP